MGIRIHKVIGYGLTDIKCKQNNIVDPRINPEGFLCADWETKEEKWTLKKFREWLESKRSSLVSENDKFILNWACTNVEQSIEKNRKDPYDYLIHGTEYLMPKVFCAYPVGHDDWHRSDNIIDYVEVKRSANSVKKLKNPIYPYIDFWDNRTGKMVDAGQACWFMRDINAKREPCIENIEQMGFMNKQECLAHLKPMVPLEIRYLLEYCEVFTKPEFVFQMEPILYIYWC